LACRMETQLWRNAALKAHHDLEPREVSYLSYPRDNLRDFRKPARGGGGGLKIRGGVRVLIVFRLIRRTVIPRGSDEAAAAGGRPNESPVTAFAKQETLVAVPAQLV
jgi:hypothetical protein